MRLINKSSSLPSRLPNPIIDADGKCKLYVVYTYGKMKLSLRLSTFGKLGYCLKKVDRFIFFIIYIPEWYWCITISYLPKTRPHP